MFYLNMFFCQKNKIAEIDCPLALLYEIFTIRNVMTLTKSNYLDSYQSHKIFVLECIMTTDFSTFSDEKDSPL